MGRISHEILASEKLEIIKSMTPRQLTKSEAAAKPAPEIAPEDAPTTADRGKVTVGIVVSATITTKDLADINGGSEQSNCINR